MPDNPPAHLLVAEVRQALEAGLAPGFPQKVAANALGIAQRELEREDPLTKAEAARLCAAIRAGEIDEGTLGTLIRATVAKLEIDQPGYAGLREWRGAAA